MSNLIQGGSGYARKITYEGIILENVKNSIIIDQYYGLKDPKKGVWSWLCIHIIISYKFQQLFIMIVIWNICGNRMMQWRWVKWHTVGSKALLLVRRQLTWTVAHLVVSTLHWIIFTLFLQNQPNKTMPSARMLLMWRLKTPFQKYLVYK